MKKKLIRWYHRTFHQVADIYGWVPMRGSMGEIRRPIEEVCICGMSWEVDHGW